MKDTVKMTLETEAGRRSFASESGMALLITLIVLAVASLLGLSLAFNATIDDSISANNEAGTQAFYIAEAGLNHAVDMVIRNTAWNVYLAGADGDPLKTADNGILAGTIVPAGYTAIPAGGLAFGKGRYEVQLLDDDYDDRYKMVSDYAWTGKIPLGVSDADPRFGLREDGDVYNDVNRRVVIRSTGFAPYNTTATVEGILGPMFIPAIVTELALEISGDTQISGTAGAIHSNENLHISGNPTIELYASSSKAFTISGNPTIAGDYLNENNEKDSYRLSHDYMPRVEIPDISPDDYKPQADYILGANGRVYEGKTGLELFNTSGGTSFCGWKRASSSPVVWDQTGDVCPGTYYVEGNLKIGGTIQAPSPAPAGTPLPLTILATGSIEISGNPYLTPDIPGVLFVAVGDVKINGDPKQSFGQGMIYAGDEIYISGNPPVAGNLMAKNVEPGAGVLNHINQNSISGVPIIGFNKNQSPIYGLISWRELRN